MPLPDHAPPVSRDINVIGESVKVRKLLMSQMNNQLLCQMCCLFGYGNNCPTIIPGCTCPLPALAGSGAVQQAY